MRFSAIVALVRRYYPLDAAVNLRCPASVPRRDARASRGILPPVRRAWILILIGPSVLLILGSIAMILFLPYPVPRTATPTQRAYLVNCASCHGANGRGGWRATLFLMRPGDLTDPQTLSGASDDYLMGLIKNGGATYGKPGMPAFGYHLSDAEIRDLIAYVRGFPRRRT
jgi:cytochrome c553